MQLKKWFALALVAVVLDVATPIILLSSTAATTAALTISITNPALAVIGGAAILLGTAKLLVLAGAKKRGRRAVAATAADSFAIEAVDVLFAAAGSLDQETNCGLRLVCELAATPQDQLADDELLILSLFGSQDAVKPDQVNNPVTPFQLAVFLGSQSQSPQVCESSYDRCKLKASEIMDILRGSQA